MSGAVRTIGVVTVARSDYGIYVPVLRELRRRSGLRLQLFVGGMHLSAAYGMTVRNIEEDGFAVDERIAMLSDEDSAAATGKSIGTGVIGFADAYARSRPDILVVLGDRFEMLSAVVAAIPFAMPIAHLHGGEASEGAIDESIRHAITKMSHLHFVSSIWARDRVVQMGEEPWRVIVSGAPSLDNIPSIVPLDDCALSALIGLPFTVPPLLATFHPVTLESSEIKAQVDALLGGLRDTGLPVVFTLPNADPGNHIIIDAINEFVRSRPNARLLVNMGTRAYFSLMRRAAAMVGNSSSGIIEAASFALPVVNVGNRQRGRMHGPNVVDVPCEAAAIADAVRKVTMPAFRSSLEEGRNNPYGAGAAAPVIVDALESVPVDRRLLMKQFHAIPTLQ